MNAPHNTLYQTAQMVLLCLAKWLPDLKQEKTTLNDISWLKFKIAQTVLLR